ncbi:MAG TPA: AAA family ATPase, partial [Candidatus Binatia bacterium]|nr:AAA family ATPase [Candidatus Binatia bacterium]
PRQMDAPLVGRAGELAQLQRIVARARDEASVQLVTVTAEPGGGKSRLVRELRASLEAHADPPAWRQGRCLPYGDGATFVALAEVVRAQARILETDDSTTSAAKLSEAIAALEPDPSRQAWYRHGLAGLAGVEGAAVTRGHEAAFGVWRAFLESIARRGSLVLVLEDVHWADDALLDFIEHLAATARGVALVVLCTARLELHERRPDWGRHIRNAATVPLGPLPPDDTKRLLRLLLHRDPDPATVARAGGNPLFAHELARMFERADGTPAGDIPESLQAVIAARLDTLAPEVKEVAADASVVGDVFWSGAVAAMGGLDEREARARLRRLVANDVARPRRGTSVAGQGEYGFVHVLVRDVAYRQIPRRERVGKHRAAAEWLEQLAGDRLTSHAGLIAHHYGRALESAEVLGEEDEVRELRPRARRFLGLAGDAATTLDARQARAFYRRALDLTDAGDPGHGRLLGRLAEAADLSGDLAEAAQLGEQAIAELREHGDILAAGEAMVALASTLWRLGRPEATRRRLVESAIATLEELPPSAALVRAYSRMATHEIHAGRAGACGTWSRKALVAADALGLAALKVQPLNLLGIARFETGDEAGIADIREAVRLGLEAGLSTETATAHSNLAAVTWVADGAVAALELKRAAGEFATSRGLVSMAKTIRAESLWQLHDAGLWDDALATGRDVVEADRAAGGSSRVSVMAQTVQARILADRGATDDAADLERDYLARARKLRDPQDLGPALAAAAALRRALGDVAGATDLIAELERVTRGRDPSQRVHELPHAARLCRIGGRMDIAEALIPARRAPTYVRAKLCLTSGRALLAEARGEHDAAAALQAEAAAGWHAFGCPNEEAHALLGRGRCLVALGRAADAETSVVEARAIGARLASTEIGAEAASLLA